MKIDRYTNTKRNCLLQSRVMRGYYGYHGVTNTSPWCYQHITMALPTNHHGVTILVSTLYFNQISYHALKEQTHIIFPIRDRNQTFKIQIRAI